MNKVDHLIAALDHEAPLLRAHQGPGRQQEWANIMEAASDALAAAQDGELDSWDAEAVEWEPARRPGETDLVYEARINNVEARKEGESDADYEARVVAARKEAKPFDLGPFNASSPRYPNETDADYDARVKRESRRPGESDADYQARTGVYRPGVGQPPNKVNRTADLT